MVRIVRRTPDEAQRWRTALELRRRKPDDPVDALDKIATRYLARFHRAARTKEIQGTGLVDGAVTELDPREWFGEGRSRIDFMRQRVIRADGKEASGVLYTTGADGEPFTPVKALAQLVDADNWRFLGLLAVTVLGRLQRTALDLETGRQDEASIAWWLSLRGTEEHITTRLKAQEAFARPEEAASVDPPANTAQKEPGETVAPSGAAASHSATAPLPATAEPQRRQRPSPERDRVVAALLRDHPTKASLATVKIVEIEIKYAARRTTASEAKNKALASIPNDPN